MTHKGTFPIILLFTVRQDKHLLHVKSLWIADQKTCPMKVWSVRKQPDRKPQNKRGLEEEAGSEKASRPAPAASPLPRKQPGAAADRSDKDISTIWPPSETASLSSCWVSAGGLCPGESPEHTAFLLRCLARFNYSLPPGNCTAWAMWNRTKHEHVN